jgi:hypothetical protein
MTRYDTETLRAEAGEIEARIAALKQRQMELTRESRAASQESEELLEAADAIGDELGPLRDRLDEIEEDFRVGRSSGGQPGEAAEMILTLKDIRFIRHSMAGEMDSRLEQAEKEAATHEEVSQ